LQFREAINNFTVRHKELNHLLLDDEDWESLVMVTRWLKAFRTATTEMSSTKTPMLSTTHAVFRGLQSHLKDILRKLPAKVSPRLKQGLTDAHRKLSDYYHKFDESPFYSWSSCMSSSFPKFSF
ncbi:hypothetical protein C8J56DRAFT_798608, partial [Mycena floridula]